MFSLDDTKYFPIIVANTTKLLILRTFSCYIEIVCLNTMNDHKLFAKFVSTVKVSFVGHMLQKFEICIYLNFRFYLSFLMINILINDISLSFHTQRQNVKREKRLLQSYYDWIYYVQYTYCDYQHFMIAITILWLLTQLIW